MIRLPTQMTVLNTITIVLLLMVTTNLSSCALGMRLRTEAAGPRPSEGNYRLYLYGCHYAEDLKNLVLIVDERSPYRFELFVPDPSYRIVSNLSFDRAIEQADRFLRCGIQTVAETHQRRIVAPDGATAGYEVLPHYIQHEVGAAEAVQVNYSLKNGVVMVYISLDPALERRELFPDIPGEGGQ